MFLLSESELLSSYNNWCNRRGSYRNYNEMKPYRTYRCDIEAKERPPVFKQLLALDQTKKVSDKLSDKLVTHLRHLLVDKNDLAERLCSVGSTSACESNHARIVNCGFYTKGEKLFSRLLTLFDLI